MPIKIIAPAAQALTLAELRAHVRIDPVDAVHPDDGMLQAYCLAAQGYADHYTGTSTFTQTLELALDGFPDGPIDLPQGPAQSITTVKYMPETGAEQTLSSGAYVLDDYAVPSRLLPAADTEWPATDAVANAVKVRIVILRADRLALRPVAACPCLLGRATTALRSDGPCPTGAEAKPRCRARPSPRAAASVGRPRSSVCSSVKFLTVSGFPKHI